MKKLLLVFCLFFAAPLYAITTSIRGGSDVVTLAQVSMTALNSSESFPLGPYLDGGIQCVWASASGSPAYKLQASNNGTNWNDIPDTATTVSGAAGSSFWLISPIIANYAKIIMTATNSGTLDCIGVFNK